MFYLHHRFEVVVTSRGQLVSVKDDNNAVLIDNDK